MHKPHGLTPKQEAFAAAYVETGNASEAYRRAYPRSVRWKAETVHKRASELLADGDVMGRVEALRAEHRKRHRVTVDRLTNEAWEAIELAKREGQAGAYVSALQLIAKMHGLLVDKHAVKASVEHKGVTRLEVVLVDA